MKVSSLGFSSLGKGLFALSMLSGGPSYWQHAKTQNLMLSVIHIRTTVWVLHNPRFNAGLSGEGS